MALQFRAIVDAVASHAAASGLFARVNQHEPKSAPLSGLVASVWFDAVRGIPQSGLASTSAVLEVSVRIQTNMVAEPQDDIDAQITDAVDYLFAAYSGDLDLGVPAVRYVDLIGAHSEGLRAAGGYIDQDGRKYRVAAVTVPIIINDAWEQSHG